MFGFKRPTKNTTPRYSYAPHFDAGSNRTRRSDALLAALAVSLAVAAMFVPSETLMAANAGVANAGAAKSRAASELGPSAMREGRLHHCVDWQGAASFQDAPCGIGQHTVSVRRYRIQNTDAASQKRRRDIEQEMDRRNRASASMAAKGAGRRSTPKPRSACETAKLKRLDTLERVGLKRNFELLSRLDRDVWTACKGL